MSGCQGLVPVVKLQVSVPRAPAAPHRGGVIEDNVTKTRSHGIHYLSKKFIYHNRIATYMQDYVSGAPEGQDKLRKVFNLEVRDAIKFIDDL